MSVLHKKCVKCKKFYPATKEFFNKDRNNRFHGLEARCIICRKNIGEEPCFIRKYVLEFPPEDEAIMTSEGIEVKCRFCEERFIPTYNQLRARKDGLRGSKDQACFLYCSDKCKQECPAFNFNTNGIYPLSKLAKSKDEKQQARACGTASRKELLAIQIDEEGYNWCDVCGKTIDREVDHPPEMHHTDEVAKCGLKAITSAGHMITCYDCHKKITKGEIDT